MYSFFGSASTKCSPGRETLESRRKIAPVSFWEVSAKSPNFLVLKAEKFALFRSKNALNLDRSVLLDYIGQSYLPVSYTHLRAHET